MHTYGSTARVSKYDVVLTGAGISVSPPSSIPSGDQLMRRTWDRLLRTSFTDADLVMLKQVTDALAKDPPPLWLEPLAEILLDHIKCFTVVASTYVDVSTQRTNANHEMLACLDTTHVTLNMDTLLEAAGASAWHLHGRWDEPDTIVTTVRQYSDGLPARTQETLKTLLEGARVLVIGYSGRDTDVMPILMESQPALVHWMHYGADPPQLTVRHLQDRLGVKMEIFAGGAQDVLPLLSRRPVSRRSSAVVPTTRDRFDKIPRPLRMLAAAAVAFDIGEFDVVRKLLAPVRFAGRPEIVRRKLVARAYSRAGRPQDALRTLIRPTADVRTILASPRSLNELASLLPDTGHPQIAAALNKALLCTRAAASVRVRQARADQVAGKLTSSRASLLRVCGVEGIHRDIGVTGLVDALTTLADTEKLLGAYPAATMAAQQAVELVQYANSSQRGFALRRLAELSYVSDIDLMRVSAESEPETPVTVLRRVYEGACAYADHPLMFWTAAGLADIESRVSSHSANKWLATAREAAGDSPSVIASTYLSLVEISVEKRWGSARKGIDIAEHALTRLREHGHRYRTAYLVTRVSLAECRAAAGERTAELSRLVPSLEKEAQRLRMLSVAARLAILTAAMADDNLDAATLRYFRGKGWSLEAEVGTWSPSDILHFPWPTLR